MTDHGHPYPWIPDQRNGTFRNPVLFADYSDPDVVRAGEDFFLTASSFNCVPGLPILHSTDLVNWSLINHALAKLPHPRYEEVRHGEGVWAPAIRHHDDRFRIFFPTPDEGIYVTTAKHPADQWSEPHLLLPGKGLIDPCPFWDDDGQAYLVHAYAASRAGIRNKLHVRPMSGCGTRMLGTGKVVVEIDPKLPALEGPKMLKRNGWYYISAPSGGVTAGWQVVFRSRSIYGPYEERIVLAQRGTEVNGPHQGTLVDTAEGEWWFLHFQDREAYGRIVHLQPVRWENDWPLLGDDHDEDGVGRPVGAWRKPKVRKAAAVRGPATSDEFEEAALGLQWQWAANPARGWASLTDRPGHLRLRPEFVLKGDLARAPNLLLQKFPAESFLVETALELPADHPDLQAGLVVMGSQHAALVVTRDAEGYGVRLKSPAEGGELLVVDEESLILQVRVGEGGVCRFGVIRDGGGFHQIGPAFTARPGKWIGAKVGLFCVSTDPSSNGGHADFEYCRFGPPGVPGRLEPEGVRKFAAPPPADASKAAPALPA